MKNQETTIEVDINGQMKECIVTSKNATKPFNLHELDVEFIEMDIINDDAISGEMEVIVEEGLIDIKWKLI